MVLTRTKAHTVIENIRTMSDYPWKHELNYLHDTLDHLFALAEANDRRVKTDEDEMGEIE